MKKMITSTALVSFISITGCANNTTITREDLETDKHYYSYAVGYQTGRMFNENIYDFDIDIFMAALRDALDKQESELLMTLPEMEVAMQNYQEQAQKAQLERRQQIAAVNKEKEELYLAENATKKGVAILPSGIQYEVIAAANGSNHPHEKSTVLVHYHGTLIDGSVFDSSRERGNPASLNLDRVIPGWREVITRMSPGDRWLVTIPSELAYGEEGSGNFVPPSATLIFDIELLEIKI